MKCLFLTDLHLGKRLQKHTTSASQKLMMETIYERAVMALGAGVEQVDQIFMLGDLFDKYSNNEDVILQGLSIARRCNIVLQGNHDVKNVEGLKSSLDLVREAVPDPDSVVVRDLSDGPELNHWAHSLGEGLPQIWFVPHCFTQDEFAQSVAAVCAQAEPRDILCLHCNVNDGYGEGVDPSGSGLYLTSELQELVSSTFRYTLVGHEHVPRRVKNNLLVLGNHFPMGFGEIADRYVYIYDTETDSMEKIKVFDASKECCMLDSVQLLEEGGETLFDGDVLFVDVTGEQDHERRPDVNRALLKLWKENPQLIAVRNDIEYTGSKKATRANSGENLVDVLKRNAVTAGFAKELEEILSEVDEENPT